MLPGEPDGWGYYRAIEEAPPPNFRLGVIAAIERNAVVAAAPVFQIDYRLDTPIQGRLRRAGDWVYSRWPSLVSRRVIGIGSPLLDSCTIGFAPELGLEQRQEVFTDFLKRLGEEARAQRCALITVKSLGHEADALHARLTAQGYVRITSLPTVVLHLRYRGLDHYLDSLPEKNGSYLRRKMRPLTKISIEYRSSIQGLESKIFALFENTRAQSKGHYAEFEMLHPDYFAKVLDRLGDRVKLMLCWHGEELLSFQIFLVGRHRIIARDIGMKYPQAREFNLYFINWIKMIEFALENRISIVDMGATTYSTKALFGGYLDRKWLYFRFTGRLANSLFSPLGQMFDFERNDPDLRKANPQTRLLSA
jgi:hypothetical protein